MKEAHAEQKWCPFARVPDFVGDSAVAINRDRDGEPITESMCLGRSCMAWIAEPSPLGDHGRCGLVK